VTEQIPLFDADVSPQGSKRRKRGTPPPNFIPGKNRLFFAIFPDRDTSERIAVLAASLQREHRLKGSPLRTDRFHITLHHLGDHSTLRTDIVEQATRAAEKITASQFQVVFDRAMSFSRKFGDRPFVLRGDAGLKDLIAVRNSLNLALQEVDLDFYANSTFTPHVTLLYDKTSIAERSVDTIEWTASELVLVHSLIGDTVHNRIGTWSLRA
jgi:2'-5' RNA ligase